MTLERQRLPTLGEFIDRFRRIVAEHLPAFVERIEHDGGGLPAFVTAELEGLLRCGDFEHGFLRLCCARCGDELRIPLSCKGRGVCPSCIGRRMSETAANWLDHLLPRVPYRQWVLSFDSSWAVRLVYDARALALVCRSFARRVGQQLRRLCKRQHGLRSVATLHPGLLVVVQRFRSDCGLRSTTPSPPVSSSRCRPHHPRPRPCSSPPSSSTPTA